MPKVPKIRSLHIFSVSLKNMGDKVHVKIHDHYKVLVLLVFVVTYFIKKFIGSLPEFSFDKYCVLIFSVKSFASIFTIFAEIAILSLIILCQIVSLMII